MRMMRLAAAALGGAWCAGAFAKEAAPAPAYEPPAQPVAGVVRCVGSSTVSNLLQRVSEAFRAIHPGVTVEIVGSGSSSGPPALTSGAAPLAPMSRPMRDGEREAFRSRQGRDPAEFIVAIDAVAVFVEKNNPVEALTLRQIDAVFSAERRRGGSAPATWGDLGATGALASAPLARFTVREGSGANAVMSELVFQGGPFAPGVSMEPVSSSVVQGVGAAPGGVGAASVFFDTPRVKPIAVIDEEGVRHEPTEASCAEGKYPLARPLMIYANLAPEGANDALAVEFLWFMHCAEGQAAILEGGNFAAHDERLAAQRALLAPIRERAAQRAAQPPAARAPGG